jgi:hypothetical protein
MQRERRVAPGKSTNVHLKDAKAINPPLYRLLYFKFDYKTRVGYAHISLKLKKENSYV